MKRYRLRCPNCGSDYEVRTEFEPTCCMKCGSVLCDVSPIVSDQRYKARLNVEEKMQRLDEMLPEMFELQSRLVELRAEYEDLLQYKRRGIVTEEELAKYAIRTALPPTNLNESLKEYRHRKGEEFEQKRTQSRRSRGETENVHADRG